MALVRNAMHGKSEKMMKIKVINRIEYGEKDHKNRPHVNGPLSGGKKRGQKTEKRHKGLKPTGNKGLKQAEEAEG